MGVPKTVKYFFVFVGLTLLGVSFFVGKSRYAFVKASLETEGEVIDLVSVHSKGRTGSSTTYAPYIQFTDAMGRKVYFISTISSNPPSYDLGEKVTVIYDSEAPEEARMKGFFAIWGMTSICGLVGTIFFTIGYLLLVSVKRKKRKQAHLRQHGVRITPDYLWVEINDRYSVNGKNPYQILAQWTNQKDLEEHVFFSENLWFDPKSFIGAEEITVLVDPENPKKYLVDLPFLKNMENTPSE